jgi:hypothetical protein
MLTGLLVLLFCSPVFAAAPPLTVLINGTVVEAPADMDVVEGQVMVPLRWAAEQLGASSIDWESETRTIIIKTPQDIWPLPDPTQNLDWSYAAPHRKWILDFDRPSDPVTIRMVSDDGIYEHSSVANSAQNRHDRYYLPMDWLEYLFKARVNYDNAANVFSILFPDPDRIKSKIAFNDNQQWELIVEKDGSAATAEIFKGDSKGFGASIIAAGHIIGPDTVDFLLSTDYRSMPFGGCGYELYSLKDGALARIDLSSITAGTPFSINVNETNQTAQITANQAVTVVPLSDLDLQGYKQYGTDFCQNFFIEMNLQSLPGEVLPELVTTEVIAATLPHHLTYLQSTYKYDDGAWKIDKTAFSNLPPDENTDNTSLVYENNEFGFSLLIPQGFMDEIEIKAEGNAVYFVNKEIQATYPEQIFGVVGRIEIYDKTEFGRNTMLASGDAYGLKYLAENDAYLFGWAHATDVQVPHGNDQLLNKFRAQEKEFDEMIKTFIFAPPTALYNHRDP